MINPYIKRTLTLFEELKNMEIVDYLHLNQNEFLIPLHQYLQLLLSFYTKLMRLHIHRKHPLFNFQGAINLSTFSIIENLLPRSD